MDQIAFHTMASGERIAYRFCRGDGPVLIFLPGYMSDMEGSKASAVFALAQEEARACLLMDYSGCGHSEGEFAQGTLSKWAGEIEALIAELGIEDIVLIGSSMGGWLMLLLGEKLGPKLRGMVGIASAPDFTDWGRSEADKARLLAGETVFDPNPYGDEPTPMHPGFFADAEAHLRLGDEIAIDCGVHLLHGQRDEDVPFEISLRLARALRSDAVKITLVKDGDHRLSRECDIALLLDAVRMICEQAKAES